MWTHIVALLDLYRSGPSTVPPSYSRDLYTVGPLGAEITGLWLMDLGFVRLLPGRLPQWFKEKNQTEKQEEIVQGYVPACLMSIWTFTFSCFSGDHTSCLMVMLSPTCAPAFPARCSRKRMEKA
uniref:Uncharacterized protein n=1 Tax=Arundo donax TaxID=35708 RepID=A0A0A9CYU2_ARUDO